MANKRSPTISNIEEFRAKLIVLAARLYDEPSKATPDEVMWLAGAVLDLDEHLSEKCELAEAWRK